MGAVWQSLAYSSSSVGSTSFAGPELGALNPVGPDPSRRCSVHHGGARIRRDVRRAVCTPLVRGPWQGHGGLIGTAAGWEVKRPTRDDAASLRPTSRPTTQKSASASRAPRPRRQVLRRSRGHRPVAERPGRLRTPGVPRQPSRARRADRALVDGGCYLRPAAQRHERTVGVVAATGSRCGGRLAPARQLSHLTPRLRHHSMHTSDGGRHRQRPGRRHAHPRRCR